MALRFAIAFTLMSSIVAKRSPLSPSIRFGNSQKSHGAISGEYGGCGIVEI